MNIAEIKYNDIANGEGVRTSLFVSGCKHRCKNCFNAVAWDFKYGSPFDDKTQNKIISSLKPYYINGLTLLGGEPFEPENQAALLDFLKRVRKECPAKNIWCYSGFTYEEIVGINPSRAFTDISKELLSYIDVLVDGKYIDELHDITLKFRGSSNQRIIDINKTLSSDEVVLYLK